MARAGGEGGATNREFGRGDTSAAVLGSRLDPANRPGSIAALKWSSDQFVLYVECGADLPFPIDVSEGRVRRASRYKARAVSEPFESIGDSHG